MDGVKRIWYLSPMRAAKVQASLRIRAVSPEPSLLAYTSSESRGTFRQKARSQAPLNGWACTVRICDDGMLEDTNSLDGAHIMRFRSSVIRVYTVCSEVSVRLLLKLGLCRHPYLHHKLSSLSLCVLSVCFKCLIMTPIYEPRQANLCLRAFRHEE